MLEGVAVSISPLQKSGSICRDITAPRCSGRDTTAAVRSVSRCRERARVRPRGSAAWQSRPARHPIHLRNGHQRKRDGSADAAAQRWPPAVPAFRAQHDAGVSRDALPGSRRQRRPSLQHAGPPFLPDADRPSRRRQLGADGQPRTSNHRFVGGARWVDTIRRVLGSARAEPVRGTNRSALRVSRAASA